MNIRLKRIIKIGLPLIIFLINICSAAEENENAKKNRAIFISLIGQGVVNPQINIIKLIENIDNYLEEYDESNEKKYRVRENEKELLKAAYQSLLEENKKVNLNNNDEEPWCTDDCNKEEHKMKLPTCGQEFCKYAFFLHLQCKLFDNKKIISCPRYRGIAGGGGKSHLCSFSLGKVKIIRDEDDNFVGKEAEINEDLSKFLEEFGDRPISTKEDNMSLREFIKKIILGGANDNDFNTGDAKKCMYCQNTLYRKNCIEGTKILCTGCDEEPICFKCLCKWDDSRIDHEKCIDSIDCDLFQGYGTGKIFVGEKNDYNPNDDGFENFETNKYYHPRRCYNCKDYIGKDRACNHATCPCGAQWCWFCGAPYDDNHWNATGNCYGLHFEGDYYKNFDPSLNARMQLKNDDLLPWERKENTISKEEIQKFIDLKNSILNEKSKKLNEKSKKLNEKSKKLMVQDENDQLCCNCFLDCLDKIKNCFSNI